MKSYYPVFFALLLSLPACLDPIELEVPARPTRGIAVQGELIKGDPSLFEVKVEQLFFYTSNLPRVIKDAEVTLWDDEGRSLTAPSPSLSGIYRINIPANNPDFSVNEDRRYRISVAWGDSVLVESTWESILPVPQADSIHFALSVRERVVSELLTAIDTIVSFSIDTPVREGGAPEKARLRWEFRDAYKITDDLAQVCYIENPTQTADVFLLDATLINEESVTDYHLFDTRQNQRFIEGYYLTVFQQALSEPAFTYWEQVDQLNSQEGTIFDEPPGVITTNLTNLTDSTLLTLGFFSAYQQDTIRRYLSPADMGFPNSYCPRPPTSSPMPPITVCNDCTAATGSSLQKPPYWEE